MTSSPPTVPSFEGRPLPHPDEPAFDQGLQFDVETLIDRRRVLKLFGYGAATIGLASLAACMPAATPGATSSHGTALASPGGSSGAGASAAADCAVIPEETAGPFPGDGSNGPDVLTQSGVVRQDIRSSFGSSTTVAPGVPLTIRLAIQDLANGCAPLASAAVYVWHCDRAGRYSMYSPGRRERELPARRPGGRRGRRGHLHQHLPGLLLGPLAARPLRGLSERSRSATDPANKIATSQIALPEGHLRRRCTRPPATSRACPTSARSRCRATTSSATTAASTSSARSAATCRAA